MIWRTRSAERRVRPASPLFVRRAPWITTFISILVSLGLELWNRFEANPEKPLSHSLAVVLFIALLGYAIGVFIRLDYQIYDVKTGAHLVTNLTSDLSTIREGVDEELLAKPGLILLGEAWSSRIERLRGKSTSPRSAHAGLTLFVRTYSTMQAQDIGDGCIETTSDFYTTFINDASQKLAPREKGSPLVRFQITSMLPEDFFNGPQIVFQRDGRPRILCHRWEGEYGPWYRGTKVQELVVERCLLVRDTEMRHSKLSALSTFDDLKSQAHLYIREGEPEQIERRAPQRTGALARLRRKDPDHIDNFIEKVLGAPLYFFPIADRKEDNGVWNKLLHRFESGFQNSKQSRPRYARLGQIDEGAVADNGDEYFVQGRSPEISLFGTRDASGALDCHFGVIGQWKPLTRAMSVRFLNARETSDAYEFFSAFVDTTTRKGRCGYLTDLMQM